MTRNFSQGLLRFSCFRRRLCSSSRSRSRGRRIRSRSSCCFRASTFGRCLWLCRCGSICIGSARFRCLRLCGSSFGFRSSSTFRLLLRLRRSLTRGGSGTFRCLRQILRYFFLNSRISLANHSKRVYAEQLRLTLVLLRKPSVCWRQGYTFPATARLANHELTSLRIAHSLHNVVDTHGATFIVVTWTSIHADQHAFFKTSLSQLLFVQDLSGLFAYVSNNAFRRIVDRSHIFFRENFSTGSSIDLLHHRAVCCSYPPGTINEARA